MVTFSLVGQIDRFLCFKKDTESQWIAQIKIRIKCKIKTEMKNLIVKIFDFMFLVNYGVYKNKADNFTAY